MGLTIAIDFDDTITEYRPFPELAPMREVAIRLIHKWYREGHKLILWTAREEPYYTEALERLRQAGIYDCFSFDYEIRPTGKVEADFYIDDRAWVGEIDWQLIDRHIENLARRK